MKRPSLKPPRKITIPLDLERELNKNLEGWVVGWNGLYLDKDGYLGLRNDAQVFKYWIQALFKSMLVCFIPIPFFWGWPHRNK